MATITLPFFTLPWGKAPFICSFHVAQLSPPHYCFVSCQIDFSEAIISGCTSSSNYAKSWNRGAKVRKLKFQGFPNTRRKTGLISNRSSGHLLPDSQAHGGFILVGFFVPLFPADENDRAHPCPWSPDDVHRLVICRKHCKSVGTLYFDAVTVLGTEASAGCRKSHQPVLFLNH